MKMNTYMRLISLCALLPLTLQAAPTVYIPLGSGNGIAEVDAATDTVTKQYDSVKNPHGLVATPDGEYLLAGSIYEDSELAAQGDKRNSNLYLVHPAHGHVMQTIPVEGWSHHQAITPDGRYVLSTHPTRNHVSVVDVENGSQTRVIATGNTPYYVAVTRDGTRAYVSNSGSGTVQEINIANWQVSRTFAAGAAPEHMVLSHDDTTLYVNNARKGVLSIIPLQDPAQRQEVAIAQSLHGLDISDDGQRLFISSKSDGKLIAFDLASGAKTELALSPAPYHLNTITGTGKVYVSSRQEPLVWVVDQQSMALLTTFTLPAGEGHQMAIIP